MKIQEDKEGKLFAFLEDEEGNELKLEVAGYSLLDEEDGCYCLINDLDLCKRWLFDIAASIERDEFTTPYQKLKDRLIRHYVKNNEWLMFRLIDSKKSSFHLEISVNDSKIWISLTPFLLTSHVQSPS